MFHVLIKLTKLWYTRGLFPDKASERGTMESKINTWTLANSGAQSVQRPPGGGSLVEGLLKIKWRRRSSINGREASAGRSSHTDCEAPLPANYSKHYALMLLLRHSLWSNLSERVRARLLSQEERLISFIQRNYNLSDEPIIRSLPTRDNFHLIKNPARKVCAKNTRRKSIQSTK